MKQIIKDFKLSYEQTKYNISDLGGKHYPDLITYEANSIGLRSPELSEHADIAIIGCSYSYGVGVPEDMSWGAQVANHFNLPYHNLSSSGKGIPFLIDHLFSYFKHYGHPKILICLFPNASRMQIYSDPKQMISKDHLDKRSSLFKNNLKSEIGITFNANLSKFQHIDAKYSQAPHKAEDVMPVETAAALSFQYIKFLEMYCKLAGIKLIWSTWDILLELGLESFDHDYENFIDTGNRYWHSRIEDSYQDRMHSEADHIPNPDNMYNLYHKSEEECNMFVDCHSELREKYGKNWDIASDLGFSFMQHWGIHHHTHIAEKFIKRMETL